MNCFFRALVVCFLFSSIFFLPENPSVFATGAYRYADDPQQNDEDTEYLDENGNPVKQYEYEEELRKQAEALQKSAAAPFGKANTSFGSAKPKMLEMKTINSQFSTLEDKTPETPESEVRPPSSGSGIFDDSKKETQSAAPVQAKPAPSKPRVLVS